MVKDRLAELQAKAELYGEDISIMEYFTVIDMEQPILLDIFCQIDKLRNTIRKIAELVAYIECLQNCMLLPLPDIKNKDILEQKMIEIRQLSKIVHTYFKEMEQIQKKEAKSNVKNIREDIINSQFIWLKKQYLDIMDKYYGLVVTYHEKCEARVIRQIEIVGLEKIENEIDQLIENQTAIFYSKIEVDRQEAKQTLNDMITRQSEIMKLENNIRELHGMFIDVVNLVHSQGMEVPSIEENVIQAFKRTKRSTSLVYATHLDRSSRKKKIYFAIMFICITFICIVYLIKIILSK